MEFVRGSPNKNLSGIVLSRPTLSSDQRVNTIATFQRSSVVPESPDRSTGQISDHDSNNDRHYRINQRLSYPINYCDNYERCGKDAEHNRLSPKSNRATPYRWVYPGLHGGYLSQECYEVKDTSSSEIVLILLLS